MANTALRFKPMVLALADVVGYMMNEKPYIDTHLRWQRIDAWVRDTPKRIKFLKAAPTATVTFH